MRDYVAWHDAYDDPDSTLSWRLRTAQHWLHDELDARPGPLRVLSLCAGDGRDILGVLAARDDAARVSVTLLEISPALAGTARDAAAAAALTDVEVRTLDAGRSDSYAGAVPADIVIMIGIFGNIGAADIERTARTAPQLCAPGATLLWSRGRRLEHGGATSNTDVRGWFAAAGFAELDYATLARGSHPALARLRLERPAPPLVTGQTVFTFVR